MMRLSFVQPLLAGFIFGLVWGVVMHIGKKLVSWWKSRRRGRGISIVIPFRSPSLADERVRNIEWLKTYWRAQLPAAELIIGEDPSLDLAFSKSVAVNNGIKKSKGDVIVIADADAYLPADRVLHCAAEIRNARSKGRRLWFMPFRLFYRLSDNATMRLLQSDIRAPYEFPATMDPQDVCNLRDANPAAAHRYGALMQIIPREAFDIVGGWDERFRGWGAEDHAAMRATDTLYGPHKTLPTAIYHLWHPMLGSDGKADIVDWRDRRWEGQQDAGSNNQLSHRYYSAFGKPEAMRRLVDEWKNGGTTITPKPSAPVVVVPTEGPGPGASV